MQVGRLCGGRRHRSGQSELKSCAAREVIGSPQATAMRLNDGLADAKPHAGAVRLGGKKRIEDLFRLLRGKPYAGIGDGYLKLLVFRRCDLMANSRVPSTSFIASMLFTIRFIMTCCNCTRSPMIRGRSAASSVRTDMLYRIASLRSRAIVSRMISFTSTNSRFKAPFSNCERILLMISPASFPSLTILVGSRARFFKIGLIALEPS